MEVDMADVETFYKQTVHAARAKALRGQRMFARGPQRCNEEMLRHANLTEDF
jgi:hypothetical protein